MCVTLCIKYNLLKRNQNEANDKSKSWQHFHQDVNFKQSIASIYFTSSYTENKNQDNKNCKNIT